ncbi:hypothetical protein GR7B_00086 [Vibrio phage vB_VcorM_GR7B]|nr:hypothetical protein GR7B_00086 [Vibrio phage vB_VcorM_GR7B]
MKRIEVIAARSLLVTEKGTPIKDDAVRAMLKKVPAKYKPPIQSWLRIKPFTAVKSLPGGGFAAYSIEWSGKTNKRIIKVTPKVFKDKYGWSILLHECLHAVLFQEQQTHAMLKNGELLLRLLGENPRDPKFDKWKKRYSDSANDYTTTKQNGEYLAKLLDMGIAGGKWASDTYMLGNYIETVPMATQLLANGFAKNVKNKSKGKLDKFFEWVDNRYDRIGKYPIS